MASLNSTQEIKKAVLKNGGEVQDGGSSYDEDGSVIDFINDAYLKILSASNMYDVDVGEVWPWAKARSPKILILKAPYATGTVTLSKGSNAGVFTTLPDVGLGTLAYRFLKVDGMPDWPRIDGHVAGAAAFTLDAPWADDDGSFAFKAIALDYDVGAPTSKVLRLCSPCYTERTQSDGDQEGHIFSLDQRAFRREWPFSRVLQGVPTYYSEILESSGVFTIRFNRFVEDDLRVELDYVPMPETLMDSSDSVPIIPLAHRCVLEYAASYRLLLEKEDDKAAQFLGMTQAELKSMMTAKRKTDHQSGGPVGELIPRGDLYGQRRGNFRLGR